MLRFTLPWLSCVLFSAFTLQSGVAQPIYTANDTIPSNILGFYPGSNMGSYPPYSDEELAEFAIGKPSKGITGVGARALRPGLTEDFLGIYGYDSRVSTYTYFKDLGLNNHTVIVGFPQDSLRETTYFCSSNRSELFANLYEPIWLNGQVNPNNYYAAYLYKTVSLYKDYVKFWEIWNEPGFDFTYSKGFLPLGAPGNWWDADPEPCDYKLRAPIQHYVRMLRISYEVIKTIDSEAYVLCGGVGYPSFLDAILRNTDNPNGGTVTTDYPLKGGAYFDVLGFHAYPHFDGSTREYNIQTNEFDYFRHSDAAAEGIVKSSETYQDVLKDYGYDNSVYPKKLITITEINAPRVDFGFGMGGAVAQRNYLTKAYVTCAREGVAQMHVFALSELGKEEQADEEFDLMGLYKKFRHQDGIFQTKNEEAIALESATNLLFGKKYDATQTANMQLPNSMDGGAFIDKQSGLYTYALWAKTTIDQSEIAQANYQFPTAVGTEKMLLHTWDFGTTSEAISFEKSQSLTLDASPIFLTENAILPSKASICIGETIDFELQADLAGLTFYWQFEGGSPTNPTSQSPSVTYQNAGIFPAHLYLINGQNDTVLHQTISIFINDIPTVNFITNVNGNHLIAQNFSASDLYDFSWDFGDGNKSLEANPKHVYASDGSYQITLSASNVCGVSTATKTVQIDAPTTQLTTTTAEDIVATFDGEFRPAAVLQSAPNWTETELINIAAGNPFENQVGAGVRSAKVLMPQQFFDFWGYDIRIPEYNHARNMNLTDMVGVLGFPTEDFREQYMHCATLRSNAFRDLYLEIWDDGANGTPINDENPFALYVWQTVHSYKDYIKYWQVSDSPDFDISGQTALLPSGAEGNWWDFDPDPCNHSLHAPIQYYIRMMRIAYEIVHSEDPDAQLLFGGIAAPSFLDAVLRNTDNPDGGAILPAVFPKKGGAYFDALGFNVYPHIDGSTRRYDQNLQEFVFQRHSDAALKGLFDLRDQFETVLENRGFNGIMYPKKHWLVSEFNVPRASFDDLYGGESTQRNYIQKALIAAHAKDFIRLTVNGLQEVADFAQATSSGELMGLYQNLNSNQAYNQTINEVGKAFKTASDVLFGTEYDAVKSAALNMPNGTEGFAFRDAGGNYIYALWAKTEVDLSESASAQYSFPAGLIQGNLYKKEWDWSYTNQQDLIAPNNIQLSGTPIFLTEAESPLQLPTANFEANKTVLCQDEAVTFTSTSLHTDSLFWSFPNATVIDANPIAPIVSYSNTGTYTVELLVKNANGTNRVIKQSYIEVTVKPIAEFETEINGGDVRFLNTTEGLLDSVLWLFSDGTQHLSYDFNYFFFQNGTYDITMIAYNKCGTDTAYSTIEISSDVVANFNVILPNVCDAFYVTLQNTAVGSPENYLWLIPGGNPSQSTDPNPFIGFFGPGVYEATLIVSNNLGSDTLKKSFTLKGAVNTYLSPTICEGDFLNVGNMNFDANNRNGSVTFPNGAASGCDSTVHVSLSFYPVTYNPIYDTLNVGEAIYFCGQTITEAGMYTCDIVDQNGCDGFEILFVEVLTNNIEVVDNQLISAYPNPAIDLLNLDLTKVANDYYSSEIISSGIIALQTQWNLKSGSVSSLNIALLPQGAYWIIVKQEGTIIFAKQFVKM